MPFLHSAVTVTFNDRRSPEERTAARMHTKHGLAGALVGCHPEPPFTIQANTIVPVPAWVKSDWGYPLLEKAGLITDKTYRPVPALVELPEAPKIETKSEVKPGKGASAKVEPEDDSKKAN